jgi:hypothetical protein
MNFERFVRAATLGGVALFVMAASASAAPLTYTVTFSTNGAGTGFGAPAGGLTLNQSSGEAASLLFTPNVNSTTGVPSNVNYGNFTVDCPTCTTQADGQGAFFDAFTFNLEIIDVTDGATGQFVGSSTGGSVYLNLSDLNVTWLPLVIGPGTNGALTGDFGTTSFEITNRTRIVAPNSGTDPGQTTVQGNVVSSAVPEPATLGLIGGALLGLGFWRRKQVVR